MHALLKPAAALATLALVACQLVPAQSDEAVLPAAPAGAAVDATPALMIAADTQALPAIQDLLQMLLKLQDANGAEKKNLTRKLAQNYKSNPSVANKLRLALALSVPMPANGESARARRLIGDLRSATPPLPEAMDLLLRLRLADMNLHAAQEEQLASLTKEQETLTAEHEALRLELEDAQAKLKALTMIEQKIEGPAAPVPAPIPAPPSIP